MTTGGPHADDDVARVALARYAVSGHATLRMINLSENSTYLLHDPATGSDGILRVHRENYHPVASIESEITWLDALRHEAGIHTPVPVPATDGSRVVTVIHGGHARHVVLFERVGGIEPDEHHVTCTDLESLGELTARLHRHSRAWHRPAGFQRFSWDWEHTLGGSPRWGRWQDGIGVGDAERARLEPVVRRLHERLQDYGDGPDRYGLVHADLRMANLLVDGERTTIIDFDDSGFSWFLYDFATALSFLEDDPRVPQWTQAWLTGYRRIDPLSPADEGMLGTFVMLRRLMLLAWMGSHPHSREARDKGPTYAAGTCALGDRYLSSGGTTT